MLIVLDAHSVLFSELVDKFQAQTSAGAFVSVNSGRHKDKVWPHQLLDNSNGYSSCLIDNQELSLSKLRVVLRSNILNSLSMISGDVHTDHCIVEFWVCALQDLIVLVFLIVQSVEATEEELENTC